MDLFSSSVKKIWGYKFFRFIVIGFVNTLFGYGIFAFLIFLNIQYNLALLISTILGTLFNFFSIGHIVFNKNKFSLIIRFIAVYIIIYVINIILLDYLVGKGITPYYSQALCLPFVASLAFLLNKYWVFS